jgi:RNA polymerase sigma-70 factor, ECF subfamily
MEALQIATETGAAAGLPGSDGDLLSAAKQGQPGAFDAVVATYRNRVFNQCLRRGLNEEEAADVTQDVFIKAYRYLDRYEHQNAFRTWLFRIAENTCIDYCRKRAREHAVTQPIPTGEDGDLHDFAGTIPDPQANLEATELRGQIAAALAALSPLLREAFLMKEEQGLRYEEIARQLGTSLGTVKSRIFRARQELMERLGPLL